MDKDKVSENGQKPPELTAEGANRRAALGCLIASIAMGALLFAFGLGAFSEYKKVEMEKEGATTQKQADPANTP